MDKKTELFVIDDTKVLSDLTRKIDEEPGDSAKDLRVTLQDKVPISEWCDDLNKVLLRQPLVQCVNFSANLVTREIVHGMGKRSTIQNVMPGICFELILMIREGKSSGVNRLVRQKQELRLMANDETHVFDEMSARSRDKLIQYHKKRAIGEDFRDEFFYTNRYLCEITGLNVENEIKRYYSEGMDITDKRCQMIFGAVGEQYPFETLEHK
ncbi:hypothetical protein V6N13_121920 [Hibiscus sabdariffa]